MNKSKELLEVLEKKDKVGADISRAWSKYASGVQVDIFDLSKIDKDVKADLEAGMSMEDAIKKAVKKYRKN